MRALVKYIVSATYKPLLVKYLSKTRPYSYKGIRLVIPPQVFHPGVFYSTKILFRYLAKEQLKNKSFLELGAGSGLLSIYAAKKGAFAAATDISRAAIDCIKANAQRNSLMIGTFLSDLFDDIPKRRFDFIVINPPYYKKKPVSIAQYAWYCGENGEYFQKLFAGLNDFVHDQSNVIMVLCDACDLKMIKSLAVKNSFTMQCVYTKTTIIEKNYIFKILHRQ